MCKFRSSTSRISLNHSKYEIKQTKQMHISFQDHIQNL